MRGQKLRRAVLGILICLSACHPVRAASSLGKQLHQQFHRSIVVSVDRRTHLILIVPMDTSATAPDTNPDAFARQVAEFARARYGYGTWLKNVTVMLDGEKGPVSSYTWTADDLAHAPAPAAAPRPVGERTD
jgi:hypothetical protein